MIKQINKIFFVGFFITIIFSLIISKFFHIGLSIGNNIFLLFLICLIPFIEKLLNFIKNDSEKRDFGIEKNDNLFKYFCLILLASIIFFSGKANFFSGLSLFLLAFGIIFKIDERYFFATSLFLLIFTILQIIFGNQNLAEILAIYVYYYLSIGILLSIFNLKNEKNLEKNQKNIKNSKKINSSFIEAENYFIYYFGIILFLIYSGNNDYLKFVSIFFFIIYLVGNFFGNELDFTNNKNFEKSTERNFIIISSIMGTILLQFLFGNEVKNLYIYQISLFFMIFFSAFGLKNFLKK